MACYRTSAAAVWHQQFCTHDAPDSTLCVQAPGHNGKAKSAAASDAALGAGLTLHEGCRTV